LLSYKDNSLQLDTYSKDEACSFDIFDSQGKRIRVTISGDGDLQFSADHDMVDNQNIIDHVMLNVSINQNETRGSTTK